MARTTIRDTLLVLDDEMYNLTWMVEFFESNGLKVKDFANVNDIIRPLQEEVYRCIIVDLNVPVLPPVDKDVQKKGDVFRRYPGLFVASVARNAGYRGRQVVIYSVHKDEAVEAEANRLGCTYIRKGRPREMKSELLDVLAYDPTSE